MSLFQRIRRNLSRALMRRRVRRSGNNHSRALNRHYTSYHHQAQAIFARRGTASSDWREAADRLRREGHIVLPPETWLDGEQAVDLKRKIDAAFDDPHNRFSLAGGAIRLIDGNELFPEVMRALGGAVEQLLETYWGSHYKAYSVSIYRTVPDDSVPQSSFLWHFDNAPDLQLKVMIYLDQVSENTGAFRFKSKAVSEQARHAGYWHRDEYELGRPIFEDEASTHVVEGGPGTLVIFQPGRVVHKATAPIRDHRDVAVIVVNPSKSFWREHLARNRHFLSTNAGLCMNLDEDLPENTGYVF